MAAMNLGEVDAARAHLRAGIIGSEELQLPVLRAQLRWMEAVLAMWVGDFAEAARHHEIAAQVHEQTELYEAGSGMLATATLLRERGGPVQPDHIEVPVDEQSGGQSMVDVMRTALLTVIDGPAARADADATLRRPGTSRSPDGQSHAFVPQISRNVRRQCTTSGSRPTQTEAHKPIPSVLRQTIQEAPTPTAVL